MKAGVRARRSVGPPCRPARRTARDRALVLRGAERARASLVAKDGTAAAGVVRPTKAAAVVTSRTGRRRDLEARLAKAGRRKKRVAMRRSLTRTDPIPIRRFLGWSPYLQYRKHRPTDHTMRGVLDSLILDARRFRAFLAHRFRGWIFFIALAFVAAALTLLIDGDTIVGICVTLVALAAIWLGGVWAWPLGVDRHVLRVTHVLQAGSSEANSASMVRQASLRKLRGMIEEVEPPPDCVGVRREIVARMREMDDLEAGRSDSLAERAIRMNTIRRDLISARKRLSAWDSDSRTDQLARLLDQLLRDIADTRHATEAPLEEMSELLCRMPVPQRWKGKHSRCESTLSTYLVALRRFNDARESEDAAAIRRAGQELSVEQATMETRINEYVDELRATYLGRVGGVSRATHADS